MNRYRRLHWTFLALGIALLLAGYILTLAQPLPVAAQDGTAEATEAAVEGTEEAPAADTEQQTGAPSGNADSFCLVCHANSDQVVELADGGLLQVGVNPDVIAASVHGTSLEEGPLQCVDCHGEDIFPHTQPLPDSRRIFTVDRSATICTDCHEEQTAELVDSVHADALQAGNLSAATCVDCHGAHDVQPPADQPVETAQACGNCHVAVFGEFEHSVHGEALMQGDPNVPTCSDCHGVHGIQNPTTAVFRNRSPQLCATCHGDAELMAQYDISIYVFETYLTDFHGTTVALFEQQDPNVPTNKAVCIDCHGVHDITPADAEHSQVVRENLLETCQQCHPGATSNFPDSWVGHFPPTIESHPLIFVVTLFYNILIPVTITAFLLLIATDVFRRIRRRRESDDGAASTAGN